MRQGPIEIAEAEAVLKGMFASAGVNEVDRPEEDDSHEPTMLDCEFRYEPVDVKIFPMQT